MAEAARLKILDRLIKPREWYQYQDLKIEGFCLIGTKDDQRNAGFVRVKEEPKERRRSFGLNPIKPYRDYYGKLKLTIRILPREIEVMFAIGYTINQKVVTIDDYSNFSWLRLATGIPGIIYPNLAHQKQLLDYLVKNSRLPKFLFSRVYVYLEFDLHHDLTTAILRRESGGSATS